MSEATQDTIAIIGMSGLFAGAPDVDTFWHNIIDKVDAITDSPSEWVGDEGLFDAAESPDQIKIYTRRGGFLGDLSRFDPRPFGTMPVSMVGSEPDQFLALKGAAEALADAGFADGTFDSERTGIILGHAVHANRGNVNGIQHALMLAQTLGILRQVFPDAPDEAFDRIREMMRSKLPTLTVDAVPGLVPNMMTGRIANRLNLMGPNYIMDAACASSLLAVDSAIQELRTGRADVMLAGGVNTSTSSLVYALFCHLEALSRSSSVRPFDRSADGTLLGEGQGMFVLKRLADAERDGDRVYAVVKSVGSSSDGRATGLMAPRLEGEVLAMRRAYQQSGIDPASVGLIEAHGTGIPLGDRTEIEAMRQIFGERRGRCPHVALGSVKSMIGHCIPAAGSASLIKVALALHHKLLPPTLIGEVNGELGLERTPLYLNGDTRPWVHGGPEPRRAGINSFGFGGINAHMILEEAPGNRGAPDPGAAFGLRRRGSPRLFAFAANDRDGMVAAIGALQQRLEGADDASLDTIAAECAGLAGNGCCRLAVVAADTVDLAAKLRAAAKHLAEPGVERVRTRSGIFFAASPLTGKIAFLFPGENAQYPNMLADLASTSPIVRHWLDSLDGLFVGERAIPHRLLMFPPPAGLSEEERGLLTSTLYRVDAGSECVFFADMALFWLLDAFKIRADCMVGHSTGENAALISSRTTALNEAEVGEYIRSMNAVFARLEADGAIPNGALLTVGAASADTIRDVLDRHPEVRLTMDNCPNQTILLGSEKEMEIVAGELRTAGAICLKLPLSWAYHTPAVAPMAEGFGNLFDGVRKGEPIARLYSCATAKPFPKTADAMRRTALNQYVKPVRFTDTVRRLYDDGVRIFIEVGPNNNLTGFVGDILTDKPHLALSMDHPKRDGVTQLLHVLAQLYVNGVDVDLSALSPAPAGRDDSALRPKPDRAVPLPSELPFIRLAPQEGAAARALLVGAPAARPVQASDRPAAPSPVPAAAAQAALARHFELMDDFLSRQERIALETLAVDRGAAGPLVRDLRTLFPADAPLSVVMATWNGLDEGGDGAWLEDRVTDWLSADEQAYWDRDVASKGGPRRSEWLLGRIASKSALQALLARHGEPVPGPREIAIDYDLRGKPICAAKACAGGGRAMNLSVSHKAGLAAAAASDLPIGIDLESLSAIGEVDGLFGVAFADDERRLFDLPRQIGAGPFAAVLWSAKEAAAKYWGEQLLGQQLSFRVTDIDGRRRRARVAHGERAVDVAVNLTGGYVLSLAWDGA